ncbi:BTAD domain-containing putative transcriptional regulator [Streptomyces subrutilus]|uniref:Transcriptional regulator n=1 Tax=Streptomyces subrutilus TaxID=36818 RepID=A0A1E5Q093_9ACTN|nr:BTAD domain-containing putative transcriptional regulator [Streptomyces subrutilus]OEJ35219.1 transcriptional regulator [Streptomyces subrutilus]
MPTTAVPARPEVTALTAPERRVLYAAGCGLRDAEIAKALALPEPEVAGLLGRVLAKLALPDRAAAIVHAFDCGLVVPGHGPRRQAAHPVPVLTPGPSAAAGGPRLLLDPLGPPQARLAGESVDLGPLRQQAVLAMLALSPDRPVSRTQLLDGVWGTEPPTGNVVPVYVYRLRKLLSTVPVIEHDRYGYRIVNGRIEQDVTRLESLTIAAEAAERAGDLTEVVRLSTEALALFRGEPLAALPGPFAELERLRLGRHRITLTQRKVDCQLRLGLPAEAIAELSALAAAEPLDEPVAAFLMHTLYRNGRRAEALSVFTRTRRRLAEDLGLPPSTHLRQAHRTILSGRIPR